tara:strand:+ start:890 stop:1450 length:561 start_codon:yes stop_codon:yes gene_type:complete
LRGPSLQSEQISAFADLWYEVRDSCGHDIPAKDDFDLVRLAPYLPHLAFTQRREDGTPYYYFFGTALVRGFGIDMTGCDVTQNMTALAKDQFLTVLHAADELERQKISVNGRWFIGPMTTSDGRTAYVEGLTLPYLGPDGLVRRMTVNDIVGGLALGSTIGGHDMKLDGEEFNALQSRPTWMYTHA